MRIITINFQQGAYCTKPSDYLLIPIRMIPSLFYKHSMDAIKSLSEYIKQQNIDIVCFTELDGSSSRTKFRPQLDTIAELSDINNKLFFPTYKFGKYIDQGNGVLTKYPIISNEHVRLPGDGQARYLSRVDMKIKKKIISIYVTHLSLGKIDRMKQIIFIADIIKNNKNPVILTGDFNTESLDELQPLSFLTDINKFKTYPSWNPKKAYDHVYISKHFKLKYISPINKLFSDHKGLEYELDI